ncbi:RsmD family RNA methyltransferase [Psychrobacter sp.]|uniref:RsmD family RNA methyltransferase n=1 Tax=Psychrobacter sp. TaxID=56811 RepID=UPI0025D41520|nr:RsmD family RNA methyltransferase [Psychrobacter sp.]
MAKGNASKVKSGTAGQVRIIGGQFRRQMVPFIDAEGLRPSPDRLRETLFNWIQFDLHDAKVLDLCAGSGVLGFESLSRGASWVDFIELQANQVNMIAKTAEKLKLSTDRYRVSAGDALQVIPSLANSIVHRSENVHRSQNAHQSINVYQSKEDTPSNAISPYPYHIVYIDPPYDLDLWVPMINQLIEHNLVNSESLLYIEDRRILSETLQQLPYSYLTLKETKIGQIFASLIQIKLD